MLSIIKKLIHFAEFYSFDFSIVELVAPIINMRSCEEFSKLKESMILFKNWWRKRRL
jgi:hypothetical protein